MTQQEPERQWVLNNFLESENTRLIEEVSRLKKNNHDLSRAYYDVLEALQSCVDVIEPDILRNRAYKKYHHFYHEWKEAKRLLGDEVHEEDV